MALPQRKPSRLSGYDYSSTGAYFITVCTKNRENLLWRDVEASIARPRDVVLSEWGMAVDHAILNIPRHYPALTVEHYVIMPNHVHLLLRICGDEFGRPMVAPTISTVIQQMKGAVTKQIGCSIWQKLFHDHVVRGKEDYDKIWEYIDTNPLKWTEDCFYRES